MRCSRLRRRTAFHQRASALFLNVFRNSSRTTLPEPLIKTKAIDRSTPVLRVCPRMKFSRRSNSKATSSRARHHDGQPIVWMLSRSSTTHNVVACRGRIKPKSYHVNHYYYRTIITVQSSCCSRTGEHSQRKGI